MQGKKLVQEIYKYRWLLEQLIARDLKNKYRKSVLGYLWSVLNPLLMMTIMTIVFSQLFRFQIPNYPVYLLSGQLIFAFFSEATNAGMQGILDNGAMIKKVYLPKYIFPFSRVLSSFTTMIFSMVALLIVMLGSGTPFHGTLILVPVVLIYILAFSIGVGILLSALLVFFRDLSYLWGVFLTAVSYLTPIFYPADILPQWSNPLMVFNPLYDYISMFRKLVLYGTWPTWQEHAICIGFALLALILGAWVFKRKQRDFILYI
jgi:ABC-type polysaccharide/polyol phosphate export permease